MSLLIFKIPLTARRRENLAKLAAHLEALPEDYEHFEMESYYDHDGDCDLEAKLDDGMADALDEIYDRHWDEDERGAAVNSTLYANDIDKFLSNCGTVACAIGHAPAAGIPLAKAHIESKVRLGKTVVTGIKWGDYSKNFVRGNGHPEWGYLFDGDWTHVDNHHWGAAARIRFLLDKGGLPAEYCDYIGGPDPLSYSEMVEHYEPYRIDRQAQAAAA